MKARKRLRLLNRQVGVAVGELIAAADRGAQRFGDLEGMVVVIQHKLDSYAHAGTANFEELNGALDDLNQLLVHLIDRSSKNGIALGLLQAEKEREKAWRTAPDAEPVTVASGTAKPITGFSAGSTAPPSGGDWKPAFQGEALLTDIRDVLREAREAQVRREANNINRAHSIDDTLAKRHVETIKLLREITDLLRATVAAKAATDGA